MHAPVPAQCSKRHCAQQPDAWIKETWCMCAMEHCSALKKNKPTPSAAMWPQLQVTRASEVRKKETDTVRYNLHVESKIWHKWTYLQERNRLAENTPAVAKGNRRGEGSERWAGATVIHRMDKEQGQTVQHRNYINILWREKIWERMHVYV